MSDLGVTHKIFEKWPKNGQKMGDFPNYDVFEQLFWQIFVGNPIFCFEMVHLRLIGHMLEKKFFRNDGIFGGKRNGHEKYHFFKKRHFLPFEPLLSVFRSGSKGKSCSEWRETL